MSGRGETMTLLLGRRNNDPCIRERVNNDCYCGEGKIMSLILGRRENNDPCLGQRRKEQASYWKGEIMSLISGRKEMGIIIEGK